MPHGITQCYLPPGRGDIPSDSPAATSGAKSDVNDGCRPHASLGVAEDAAYCYR